MAGVESALSCWLLAGDPAVRWRVLRDLTDAPDADVRAERARVAVEGWGAELLARQDADGRWGQGWYSPKWTSTHYTLLDLARLGLPTGHPAALRGCERLWEGWRAWRRPEECVAGMILSISSAHGYQGDEVDRLVGVVVDRQLADGGWNCAAAPGDRRRHGSFHTSISVLEGLAGYTGAGGRVPTADALGRGHDFFLRHHLYLSHRTGQVAIRASTRFPHFPQWHFDVMRGLEHFRDAGPRDPRLAGAVEVVRRARRGDGRWPTYAAWPGRTWLTPEPRGPSRWNTMRALRVLRWWAEQPQAMSLTPTPRSGPRTSGA